MNENANINEDISALLDTLESPHHTGYIYLHTALLIAHDQPRLLAACMENFYAAIAEQYKTSIYHVEEELKHTLTTMFLAGNFKKQQLILHTLHYKQPSLRDFVKMSLNYIQIKSRE